MLKSSCTVCGAVCFGSRCVDHPTKRNASGKSYGNQYNHNANELRSEFRIGDVCIICQKPIQLYQQLSIEHRIAKRDGGSDDKDNLGYAHKRCNYGWRRKK